MKCANVDVDRCIYLHATSMPVIWTQRQRGCNIIRASTIVRITEAKQALKTMKRSPGSATLRDHSPPPAPRGRAENRDYTEWAAPCQNQQNSMCAQRGQISLGIRPVWSERTAKALISLGIRPVWSESSLSAWREIATHWAQSEDSDQTGRMPRLIRVFAVRSDQADLSSLGAHAKTQISLGIRPVWSESSLSAWREIATHWAHSEDSDQTGRMPESSLGAQIILLVLSWGGSNLSIK